MTNHHFISNSADFDTNYGGMITLGEILIGGSWFTDTAAAVEVNGYVGLIYFIFFLYLSSYQLFRLFVAIIAQSFELNEEEKLEAQKILLEAQFKQEKVEVAKGNDNAVVFWDSNEEYKSFSFNTHFVGLLRGAQITLQELTSGMKGDVNSMTEQTKNLLKEVGYDDDDSDEEEQVETEVFTDEKIQKILTINTYLVKESGGAKDSEKRKLPIHVRIRNQIKTLVGSTFFNAFLILVVIGYLLQHSTAFEVDIIIFGCMTRLICSVPGQ